MSTQSDIYVNLFGNFSLTRTVDGKTFLLTDQSSSSRRLWTFLQYLVFHWKTPITQDNLIDILWPDGEAEDPVNTLKTLLHRARRSLESLGFEDGKQILTYRRGLYAWADHISFHLDTEQFEQFYEQAKSNPEQTLSHLMNATKLYSGSFLPKASHEPWVVSLRMYYHTMFLKICAEAASLLEANKNYIEIIDLCRKSLSVEPYDEDMHLLLMQALASTGAQQAAIQHYTYVTQLLMEQLGASPSEQLTSFYRRLVQATKSVEMNLHVVRSTLIESVPEPGPYYCEYAIFQDVYRLEARTSERTGQVSQLAMLTIHPTRGKEFNAKQIFIAMERLRTIVSETLRRGDVFTRFSSTQFLLLLPCANYENGNKVLSRLVDKFKRSYPSMQLQVQYSVLPLIPSLPEP